MQHKLLIPFLKQKNANENIKPLTKLLLHNNVVILGLREKGKKAS